MPGQETTLIRHSLLEEFSGIQIEVSSLITTQLPLWSRLRSQDSSLWRSEEIILADADEQRTPNARCYLDRAIEPDA
jgi:hypothetical protein